MIILPIKRPKWLCICFLFLGSALHSYGQFWEPSFWATGKDTLSQHYSQISFYQAASNYDSAVHYLNLSKKYAVTVLDTACFLNSEGWIHQHKGNTDSAEYFILQSIQLFQQENNVVDAIKTATNLAVIYSRQSRYAEAIQALLKADSLLGFSPDIELELFLKRELGILYRQTEDFEKAGVYLQGALEGFQQIHNYDLILSSALSLAILYRMENDYEKSLKILAEYFPQIKPEDPYTLGIFYENIGETYLAGENYVLAETNFRKSLEVMRKIGNQGDIIYESLGLGKALAQQKKYSESETLLKFAYRNGDSLHMTSYAYESAMELSNLYEALGQWDLAYEYAQIEQTLGDSLSAAKEEEKYKQLESGFQLKQKDQEISLLNANNEIAEAQAKRTTLIMYVVILLVAVIIMTMYTIFTRYRTKQRLHLQHVRNKIAGDLHDDIGSTLSSINMYSQLVHTQLKEKSPESKILLEKISANAQDTIQNMSDIVWAIKPVNDDFAHIENRMLNFAGELCAAKNIELHFNKGQSLSALKFPMEIRKDIYLIFKEATNNAVKYSEATEIQIDIQKQNGQLCITIRDNGKGFDIAENMDKSNGLRSMESRAAQHGGTTQLESTIGKGTCVSIRIPFT